MSPMPAGRLWGWVGPLVVTAFAAVVRFSRLSVPHAVDYDETSYIKDAWSILQHGVEWNPVANPAGYPPGQSYVNNLLLSGDTHIFAPCSGYSCGEAVVHPEVGKYLIAIGEWVFGLNPFGYRVASAPPSSLTQREYEIAELVAGGLSNKAIAAELSISHTTAARHVANIMNKLGFNSRSQIAAWVADRAQGPGRAEGPGEPG